MDFAGTSIGFPGHLPGTRVGPTATRLRRSRRARGGDDPLTGTLQGSRNVTAGQRRDGTNTTTLSGSGHRTTVAVLGIFCGRYRTGRVREYDGGGGRSVGPVEVAAVPPP